MKKKIIGGLILEKNKTIYLKNKLGPGNYFIKTKLISKNNPKFSFCGKKNNKLLKSNSPGPGEYTLKFKEVEKKYPSYKFSLKTKIKNELKKNNHKFYININKFEIKKKLGSLIQNEKKFYQKSIKRTAGPGDYTPYFNITTENKSNNTSFLNEKRFKTHKNKYNVGPGAYNIKARSKILNTRFNKSPRFNKEKIIETPGPGNYFKNILY